MILKLPSKSPVCAENMLYAHFAEKCAICSDRIFAYNWYACTYMCGWVLWWWCETGFVGDLLPIFCCDGAVLQWILMTFVILCFPSVLWRCWLGGRKGIRLCLPQLLMCVAVLDCRWILTAHGTAANRPLCWCRPVCGRGRGVCVGCDRVFWHWKENWLLYWCRWWRVLTWMVCLITTTSHQSIRTCELARCKFVSIVLCACCVYFIWYADGWLVSVAFCSYFS